MKFYVPELQLGVLSTPQTALVDKFGGLPWGLPPGRWPICRQCGMSMALVAQLLHDDDRLSLGKSGRCLFVFMCSNPDSECDSTWDSQAGSNASFVLELADLGSTLTYPPDVADPLRAEIRSVEHCAYTDRWDPARTIWINTEVRVQAWSARDDTIPPSDRAAFFDDRYFSLSPALRDLAYDGTKLGGVPAWIQAPQCQGSTFLAQFGTSFRFATPLPDAERVGCRVSPNGGPPREPKVERKDGPREIAESRRRGLDGERLWACAGPNYGGSGRGYVFANVDAGDVPACEFVWQC